jgi:hypothetical protein
LLTSPLDGEDHALDATAAKATRDEDTTGRVQDQVRAVKETGTPRTLRQRLVPKHRGILQDFVLAFQAASFQILPTAESIKVDSLAAERLFRISRE